MQYLTRTSSGRKWRHFHDKVCEMEAIVSVDGSRWSRCCNINSSVSTCRNTAAAFLQATALPPINRLNVAGIYSALLQQLTLSPCLFGNDIHIHTLFCHKAIFHSDHFLLDHILCHNSEVVGIYHSIEWWDLEIKILSTYTQPKGSGEIGSCYIPIHYKSQWKCIISYATLTTLRVKTNKNKGFIFRSLMINLPENVFLMWDKKILQS